MYTHEQFRLQCQFVVTKCYEKELHNRQNLEADEQHLLLMLSNSYHHSHHKEMKLIEENVNFYRHIQIYKYLVNIVQHVEKHLHVILNWSHDPFQMSKKLTKQIGTIQYAGHHIHHFPELHSLGKMFRDYFGMNIDQFEVCWQMIELCNDIEAMRNLYLSHFCKHYGLMAVTVQQNGHYFTELYRTYDFYIADEDYSVSTSYIPPPGAQPYNNPTQQPYPQYQQPYGTQGSYPQSYNNVPGNPQYPYGQQGYNPQQPYQQTPYTNQSNIPPYGQQPYPPQPQGQQPYPQQPYPPQGQQPYPPSGQQPYPPQGQQQTPYGQPYQTPGQQYPNYTPPMQNQQPYPPNQPQNTPPQQYQQNNQQPNYPPMPPQAQQQNTQMPPPQQYSQQPNQVPPSYSNSTPPPYSANQMPQQYPNTQYNTQQNLPPPKPYP